MRSTLLQDSTQARIPCQVRHVVMRRVWAMPDSETFNIPCIAGFVQERLVKSKVSIDPFARNKRWATHTNDLNPETAATHHMKAPDFLKMLREKGVQPDLVLFDPPYSPRQIQECYAAAGITPKMEDTQNSRLMKECKELINEIVADDAIVLSFGWNSAGMGKGWTQGEILLVCHGAGHNDTICVSESKDEPHPMLFAPHNAPAHRLEASNVN